jgi:hypothetical protein
MRFLGGKWQKKIMAHGNGNRMSGFGSLQSFDLEITGGKV